MTIHIDMSNKYNQGNFSVIAAVSTDKSHRNNHIIEKAIVLSELVRSELLQTYSQQMIHASIISEFIRKGNFQRAVICSDINPVHEVIRLIEQLQPQYTGKVMSIGQLNEGAEGEIDSAADTFARNVSKNFPKRKNVHRCKEYFRNGSVEVIESNDNHTYAHLIESLESLRIESG